MGYWTKKSIANLEKDAEKGAQKLKRTLGPVSLVMLGIGGIIGAGLFSITGIAAAENAGPAIVLSFLIAAIACTFAGLCYSEIASVIPVAGSAYTYSYAIMGELIAWLIGWTLILEYAIGAATVSISWSAYLVSLLHDFNIYLPTEIIASQWHPVHLPDGSIQYGSINLPALLIIALVSFILIKGTSESALINSIIVIIKVSIVLFFICVGYFYIQDSNLHPFIPPNNGNFGEFGWSGIMRAAGVVFFAYIGFDAVSTAAQETINPQKTIPIGILGSLLICTILYILFSRVLTGIVHYTELDVAAPVALAVNKMPYPWLHLLFKIAILAGLTSVILVLLYGQSRIFYAMSRDGLLPKVFSKVHPVWHTPWISNLILMVFVGLFGAFAPIAMVGSMTSIGTLLAFAIVCMSVLILRYKQPNLYRPFRTPWVPFVPVMGVIVCVLLMFSLEIENWLRLFIWLAIGMAVYFTYSRKHAVAKDD